MTIWPVNFLLSSDCKACVSPTLTLLQVDIKKSCDIASWVFYGGANVKVSRKGKEQKRSSEEWYEKKII